MYDIFISYSSKNEDEAKHICKILENSGLSCWLAPINIRGHHNFAADIPRAIRKSKVYLLLMSEDAQESKWVPRELVWADKHDIPIFTLFIEDCELHETFDFILTTNQYYGYSDDRENQINRMTGEIKHYLEFGDGDEDDDDDCEKIPVKDKSQPPTKKKKPKKLLIVITAIVLAAALIVAGVIILGKKEEIKGYIIWSPSYNIALTGNEVNSHYLAGERIGVSEAVPSSYSENCIWQVKFNDDGTVIISRNGITLGMEPGYNGIGLGGNYTADAWKITNAEGSTLYIQNVLEDTYLEWFADKNNWATYNKITSENRSMFILRMDPVK